MDGFVLWFSTASWAQVLGVVGLVVSGGSILAFAVAMIRDGIKNGW